MIKRYILHALPEFILCLICAVSLDINVLQSFRLTDQMYASYGLFLLVTGIVLAALFMINYGQRTRIIGIPVLIIAAVLAVLVCHRMGFSVVETDVIENNWGVCWLVVVIVALLTFIASRTQVGSTIFAIAGAIAHAWICVCLYDFSVWALVIYLVAAMILYLYSRYRHQVLNVHSSSHSFLPLIGSSLVAAIISLALAAAVWFGVLEPMHLPTADVTLVTKVVSIEVLEKVGISKKTVQLDRNTYADVPDEDYEKETNQQNEQEQDGRSQEGEDETIPEIDAPEMDDTNTQQDESILTRLAGMFSDVQRKIMFIILVIIVALLAAASIARFVLRHRIWLERLKKKERDEQIRLMYCLLQKKMALLKIRTFRYESPLRGAERIREQTMLMDEGGPTWLELSEIFSRLVYGGISPTEEEYNRYVRFYNKFWKVCRKMCGFKYVWKQFRI